ncbi:MAG: hypothetical protein JW801_06640 [Bacteroidales bacterium]|nr:hypothetical protein [Bacteroidales bacterium]
MLAKHNCFFTRIRIILLMLCTGIPGWSQTLFPDTLYIDFRGDSLIRLEIVAIPEIRDLRNEDPSFISMTTRRQLLLIPVDREIHTKDTLAKLIRTNIPEETDRGMQYYLDLNRFEIITKENKLSSSLMLVADIGVFVHDGDTERQIGNLFYDKPYIPRMRKETYAESCERLLNDWHTDFKLDLMTLQLVGTGNGPELTPNFIGDLSVKSLFLNARAGAFAGLTWYGFQGELFFSRPETKGYDRYTAGIVRYVHHQEYESFALGRKAGHYTLRWNSNWLIDADANVLMGFCKWKDMELSDPQLYQLLDLEISSVQSLAWAPLNRNSMTFRVGVMENFSYVIEKKPLFEVGLYGELGVKF